jgi:dTDP-4-dehydrorhamnose 3,5-epimerase
VIVEATAIPDVRVIRPHVRQDERGRFLETFSAARYAWPGADGPWAQDNVSVSRRGVLRGLHAQYPNPQAKLVTVLDGRVWDVVVDARRGSPTFGRWLGMELDGESCTQLFIPVGFLHGFVVLSERAIFAYKCTAAYDQAGDFAVRWDDPDLGIAWPVSSPILSAKDAAAPRLRDLPPGRLLPYAAP